MRSRLELKRFAFTEKDPTTAFSLTLSYLRHYANIYALYIRHTILFNVYMLCSKDARLPEQLQRTMAAEAEAGRAARAKVGEG